MFRGGGKVLLVGLVSSAVFNGFVWRSRQQTRGINTFNPGSADEMLMEQLQPGDLLLFKRSWENYYVPKALSLVLYQTIHGPSLDLDHCGMVFHDKMGNLHVFELSPNGYISTPYQDRIYKSHADCIIVVPLRSSLCDKDAVAYREKIFAEVEKVTQNCRAYEPFELLKGCIAKMLYDCGYKSGLAVCPSTKIIFNVLKNSADITTDDLDTLTPDDIAKKRIAVRSLSNENRVALGSLTVLRNM